MSETTTTDPNSSLPSTSEERVRKVYVRDIQTGHTVHTVFRATKKQKSTSRQGKTFLAVTLADKTGELEARVFDNVETVETAFANKDYLLVKGRVITFHNKPQLVIEALDRLDPEPMDEKEFTPPAAPPEAAAPAKEKDHRHDNKAFKKALRARLLTLLDDPVIFAGLEALVHHLEKFSQQRHSEGGQPPARERHRGPRAPRVEHKPDIKAETKTEAPAKEAATPRDASLPKDLIFKSFTQLSGETEKTPS